jgi:hypothetical protein
MDYFVIISNFIHIGNNIRVTSSELDGVFYGFAVISFILSFILLFFGKRLLRLSLGIIAFISFGSIPFWIWMINGLDISPTIILIIMFLVGAVAAFIASYFTKFGIYIIGAASGVQFGYLLTEIIYLDSKILFIILAILFGLAGLILPYYFMSYMVIEIATFNGFLLFRSGIQYVMIGAYLDLFLEPYINYKSGVYWGVLFGSLFVGCLGSIWQHYKYKNYPYLKNRGTNKTPDEKV